MNHRRRPPHIPPSSPDGTDSGQTNFAEMLNLEAADTVARRKAALVKEQASTLAHLSEYVPVYQVKLARVDSLAFRERSRIRSPQSVATLVADHLKDADREHFVVVLLDTKGQVIGICTASVGDLSSALAHPREIFKAAILANAASIILAHNHPSGDPTPSAEDAAVTRRLVEGGELLSIEVLDHIIIGENGRYVSLKEKGICETKGAYGTGRGFSR